MLITKTSGHNTVMFVVLTPNVADRNGDIMSEDQIIKTAHEFVINLAQKSINVDHQDGTDLPEDEARVVESFIAPVDLENEGGVIERGSRLVAMKLSDQLYQDALDGKISGISMEGYGIRTPL